MVKRVLPYEMAMSCDRKHVRYVPERMQDLVIICALLSDKERAALYGLPSDWWWKHVLVLFAKHAMPCFSAECAAVWRAHRIFTGIVPQFLNCDALQDGTPSGSVGHTEG